MIALPTKEEMTGEAAREAMAAWSQQQDRCAACWIGEREAVARYWPGLQTHHLVKRSRRVCHLTWNLLRLCARCHRLAEGERVRGDDGLVMPKLTFGMCLWLKRESEPENWQPKLLELLYCRRLPDIEPIPDEYLERLRFGRLLAWHQAMSERRAA